MCLKNEKDSTKYILFCYPDKHMCLKNGDTQYSNINSFYRTQCLILVWFVTQASYGVEDAEYAVVQLAQTTMRSELGKIRLDSVFQERENLNHMIVGE